MPVMNTNTAVTAMIKDAFALLEDVLRKVVLTGPSVNDKVLLIKITF